MDRKGAVVLLDMDGVLNPLLTGNTLTLDPSRADLVKQLAGLAGIVWATSWPSVFTWRLSRDLQLPEDTRTIAFPQGMVADRGRAADTPKLHWISRWLSRSFEPDDVPAVIWIDDHLLQDAREWAGHRVAPTLLIRPDPAVGLLSKHVEQVREFLR